MAVGTQGRSDRWAGEIPSHQTLLCAFIPVLLSRAFPDNSYYQLVIYSHLSLR